MFVKAVRVPAFLFCCAIAILVLRKISISSGCDWGFLAATPSPNGSWIAELFGGGCGDADSDALSIRRPNEGSNQSKVFLNGTSVFLEWQSDLQLTVAEPQGQGPSYIPPKLRGVTIKYVSYPIDPANVDGTVKEVRRSTQFTALPRSLLESRDPSSCPLSLEAYGGKYIPRLSVSVRAQHYKTALPTKDNQTRIELDASVGGYEQENPSPLRLTSAAFDTVSLSKLGYQVHWQDAKTSGGVQILYPFGVSYLGLSVQNLEEMIDRLRTGPFHVTLGFWPNKLRIVYESEAALAPNYLDAFQSCFNRINRF